jgi:hypothetical protein
MVGRRMAVFRNLCTKTFKHQHFSWKKSIRKGESGYRILFRNKHFDVYVPTYISHKYTRISNIFLLMYVQIISLPFCLTVALSSLGLSCNVNYCRTYSSIMRYTLCLSSKVSKSWTMLGCFNLEINQKNLWVVCWNRRLRPDIEGKPDNYLFIREKLQNKPCDIIIPKILCFKQYRNEKKLCKTAQSVKLMAMCWYKLLPYVIL